EAAQLIAEQLRLVQAFGVRRHVADALTNQQITENLFVTEKTVETHPGRARREPGVRSRAQLAVRMCAR
ncbi:LuxR C-terminal-related transcriptional regulator, partial [Lentzea sp.]|uniref:LuxR C-terminal-related transcriptional regulator n=1 Tax=Lentzea sp. TaxID=56099 RepID=UPI002ED52052